MEAQDTSKKPLTKSQKRRHNKKKLGKSVGSNTSAHIEPKVVPSASDNKCEISHESVLPNNVSEPVTALRKDLIKTVAEPQTFEDIIDLKKQTPEKLVSRDTGPRNNIFETMSTSVKQSTVTTCPSEGKSREQTDTIEGMLSVKNKEKSADNILLQKIENKINDNVTVNNILKNDLTKEEIKAQREKKKLEKQMAKNQSKSKDTTAKTEDINVINQKTENIKISAQNDKTDSTALNVDKEKVPEGKSKAELRAERRAKQEAQRAAKTLQKQEAAVSEASVNKEVKKVTPTKVKIISLQPRTHKVKLFAHLYDNFKDKYDLSVTSNVHPSILRLGSQYASRVVFGSNARCLALLNSLKQIVLEFETPADKEFSRGLESTITSNMLFLNSCRPISVSMANAVKHLKSQINQIKETVSENESKARIVEWIDVYIREQLETADKAICISVQSKISNGDVILTYGCSSLITQILKSAHEKGTKFRVIVVDGRPWLEGREQLRRLVKSGIHCTYIFINALSFIMPEVTKILLGAHALLANGYVMSRVGSSQVALMAKAYNVPVLVCCETHKFCERVQTDSFVYNELGNPDELTLSGGCTSTALSKWKSIDALTPLNITYDVTPPDLVSAVVTELGVLPCTSVPVILRIKPTEIIC